jgi:hypothetical protein
MMANRGKSGIAGWLASHPGRFTLREEPQNPSYRKMYGHNRLSEKFGKEKNLCHCTDSKPRSYSP